MTIKVGNNITVNLNAKSASVRMQMPFGSTYSVPPLTEAQVSQLASLATKRKESLHEGADIDPSLTFDQVNPQESDFIYPLFRALSATYIPDYALDFTKEKVVEESTPLMLAQTIYTNHVYWRVENWIGAVSQSIWDAKGDKTAGVPGINVELKVDWKSNPKIARGLLMKPPAIHSVSATIDFEWDVSHPELLEQGIFWRNLGQEIDGSIVRIVVTRISRYRELSFVYQGANPESNGHLPGEDEEEELSAPQLSVPKKPLQLATKETTKVKLNEQRKTALGLTAHQGEEVDDAIVLAAVDSLSTRATSADQIVAAGRAEVLRLATLAEGTGDGEARKLAPEVAGLIEKADPSQLPGLTTMYQAKAEAAFPRKCQKCGSSEIQGRSSVESADEVPTTTEPVRDSGLL